ncbi:inosine-uridine nucleoside N-ribohydrolase [Paenochrobactrum gallinarii]|uniref:Inosine-uridine nucleoside N-ribohydrolase n=1 Tax=Paenochrobactrum gallinarii TaxID=643673 RepID=A0A841M5M3_9HYPH|nr:inosine-uridine nucleoside N-ribohydrolase [Paenochrobactrum gallinarii]
MKTKIIIDTDPGQDDAVAILLALASPELDILGITTVAGNIPLARTQNNARKICEVAGRKDVKRFAGALRPLLRQLPSLISMLIRMQPMSFSMPVYTGQYCHWMSRIRI